MTDTAIIVGAGSGFGRSTALTMSERGWRVIAIARSDRDLASLVEDAAGDVVPIVGDGRDDELARKVLAEHPPNAVLIGGGVPPHMAPLHQQTWETVSIHWEADVALAFTWLKALLVEAPVPLRRVVALSSGAALNGSPGSGGYAGAKATVQHLTTSSAAQSAQLLDLPVTFTAVLPQLTHDTGIGQTAVAGYAQIAGQSGTQALEAAPPYTAAFAGEQLASLLGDPGDDRHASLLLTADGLTPLEKPDPAG